MADTTTLDKAKADAAGLWGNLKKGFSQAASDLVRWENDPAGLMFDKLKKDPAFASEENQKKLSVITNDKRFMSALNTGMVNDPSVKAEFLKAYADGGGSASSMKYVDSLQNGINRRTGASVLNAAGRSATDDLDGKYVMDVLAAGEAAASKDAKSEDRKKMRDLLAKSGTRDIRLEFSENPMGMMSEIFKNPQEFFKNLPTMLGFQGVQAERMGEFLQTFVGGAVDFFTGNKQDREAAGRIYNKISSGVEYYYDGMSGNADKRNQLHDRGQEILKKYESEAPVGDRVGGWKTAADNSNDALLNAGRIQAASLSQTYNPNSSGESLAGYKPPTTPVADNSDFRVQPARFGMTGPSAIPA